MTRLSKMRIVLAAFAVTSLFPCFNVHSSEGTLLDQVKEITQIGKSNAKSEILSLIEEMQKSGYVLRNGKDAEVRPPFVGAQAEIERTLAYLLHKHEIHELIGIIHTPTPATPLCTKGEISSNLVDSSIKDDKRLYTIQERPAVIRDYLKKGGVLYSVYPEGGRAKRTVEQLALYDAEIARYPDTLKDQVLNCTQIDKEMVGATYFFKTAKDGWMVFSIKATQANAPEDDIQWGVWFGSLANPKVKERAHEVLSYLTKVGGPEIKLSQ